MAKAQGTCDPRFEEVRRLLEQFIEDGEELGCSFTVNIDGKEVVDLWGGYADQEKTQLWKEDTIVNVFSTTKPVVALAIYILVERGLLGLNEKVGKYWPEFAVNGKEDIEVRHLLSHTSGVSGWEEKTTAEDTCNREESVSKLEKQAPWWTPGTASGYHSLNYGHLLGELILRTTGKTLTQFVADEMAVPLNADFQIGALEKDWPRVSNLIPPPPSAFTEALSKLDPKSVMAKTMTNPIPDAVFAHSPTWRRAEIGAANGHGTAKGITRLLSVISLGGEANEQRFLSPNLIDRIFEEQAYGVDLSMGATVRFGIGFGIRGNGDTGIDGVAPEGRVAYWGGWGGSMGIMDVDRKVTIGYVMNKMSQVGFGNACVKEYVKAVYKGLGVEQTKEV